MKEKQESTGNLQIGPGYPMFQMAKALLTSDAHEDAATRQRAEGKISKWLNVIKGILTGNFQIGTRNPVKDVPVWATPEVVTGGFVTNALLAAGPLKDHEYQWLAELRVSASEADVRRVLNSYFLSEEGLATLRERLHSNCYDIGVPEEGAFLMIAWLVENGHAAAARDLLDAISNHLDKLRFYPIPTGAPVKSGDRVHLESVATVAKRLAAIRPNSRVRAQKETIHTWLPMYDRLIALFLETVKGDPPCVRKEANGKPMPSQDGKFVIDGGWPCQFYPEGWDGRATAWLSDFAELSRALETSSRPSAPKSRLAELHEFMVRCVSDRKSLSGRDVGKIRLILAGFVAKRGVPESNSCGMKRARQQADVHRPEFFDIARAIAPRLTAYSQDDGISDMNSVLQPVTANEAKVSAVATNTPVPTSIQRKLERCRSDSMEALVQRDVITSGETLARVVPQTTSNVRAAAFADTNLRYLYAAIYRAFRRRRSLLLLYLQSQVKIEELPWIAVIEPMRKNDASTQEAGLMCLGNVAALTLRAFPHVIVPNKLLQELRALTKEAGLELPLVDELAADIFMGQFSGKFVAAAKLSAKVLSGSLYQSYYGIDWQQILDLPESIEESRPTTRASSADRLLRICETRAGVQFGGYKPAENGMIIEQQQILTTQNLAALFDVLLLKETLRDDLPDMAKRCFRWICRRQQAKTSKWHAILIMLKNTAYAWRQMIFYLSLLSHEQGQDFLVWAWEHLEKQPVPFRERFAPALRGLEIALAGESLDGESAHRGGARRFLGWSKERHWLLGPK